MLRRCPLQRIGVVDHHFRAVVAFQQIKVSGAQPLTGYRLAALGKFMRRQFELGEHGLTEEGAADRLAGAVQIEQSFIPALGALQKVGDQQLLVEGGGDFGGEGGIVGSLERLGLAGQQRMHGVAPFVAIGRQTLEVVRVVEEQIGMHIIGGAEHIGPSRLALLRIDVRPLAQGRLGQSVDIVRTQGLQRFQSGLAGGRQVELCVELGQRRIDVVIGHVRQAQQPAPHVKIAVQDRQAVVRLRHQRAIDALGNVRAVQRAGQGGRIFPRPGRKQIPLNLGRQGGAQAGLISLEGSEIGGEHLLAGGAIGGGAGGAVALAVETHGLARHFDLRPGDIGQHQLGPDRPGAAQRVAGRGQQRLAGVVQHMRRQSQSVLKAKAELAEPRIGVESGPDLDDADREHLRVHPGRGLADLGHQAGGDLAPFLIAGSAEILITLQGGVDEQPQEPPVHVRHRLQGRLEHGRAFA